MGSTFAWNILNNPRNIWSMVTRSPYSYAVFRSDPPPLVFEYGSSGILEEQYVYFCFTKNIISPKVCLEGGLLISNGVEFLGPGQTVG